MKDKISFAVIGCGHQGAYHLERLLGHPRTEVLAVVDPRQEARDKAPSGVAKFGDIEELLRMADSERPDAVVVAVPTPLHEEVTRACLEQDMAVLLEKPMAHDLKTAVGLVEASRHGFLRIGHVERFNPAVVAAREMMDKPLFVEGHRLGPYSARMDQVDVVLDLMIHDLDIMLQWTGDDVAQVRAAGAAVITGQLDIANARIEFSKGCVANLTASRASMEPMRKLRVFCVSQYLSLDLKKGEVKRIQKKGDTIEAFTRGGESDGYDAMTAQLSAFLDELTGKKVDIKVARPEEAYDALKLAVSVREAVMKQAQRAGLKWT
ncbi:MAG: Gfo/Idh/MocA family oxidoreductase [Deltaproteobacteria bacterium]|nr:Gfo/Idh/MocA family oxidoreductase [Deltaproteobacteria bacterium]